IYGSALTASQILDDYKSEVVAAKPGSGDGISLDGSNDYIQLPSVLDGATQFTVDFWIKTTENRASGTYWQKPSILGNGNPAGPDGDFGISTSNGFIGVWHGFCCGDQSFETTTAINDNKWHHVAAVNNGSNVVLFVDGIQLAGSIPTGGGAIQNAARPWRLGMINSCCPGDTPHQGTFDEFKVWNIALTQAQIRDRMCKKIVSTDALYTNLSAYYNFDEKAGSTVFDGSANSYTATFHNGASRITSGAPIGNSSSHDYSGASSSVNHANPSFGDDVTATLTSGGASGIHVYHVNEAPNSVSGVEGLETIGTYFGTFLAGGSSPQYNLVYNYDGISSISNESNLVLGTRANNSIATWAGITAALNTAANTLSVNDISNSQAEFRVAAQDAGLVSSSQANCFSYTPNPLTATPAFNNNLSATYQWQDSSVNGTWQNISGATNLAGLTLPVATSTKYYRRLATLNGSTIFSNVVIIEASAGPNPANFPNNAWNFYAYDGVSTDSTNIIYRGSYSTNNLNFNTQTEYNSNTNPSAASGYIGCSMIAPGNAWTLHAKRQGFPTGPYTLVVNQHDDNIKILKDGVEVINAGCCNYLGSNIYSLGTLNAATKIECRVANSGGPGHLQITLLMQALNAGAINGTQAICTSTAPSLLTNQISAYGGNTSTITYQWQDSIANGIWTNISGAINPSFQPSTLNQTTWYRRLAINNSETLASNTIHITVNTVVGNPALFGINQWNVYAYNGTNLNVGSGNIYRGFYTNANLNINTNNDWNSNLSPSAAANYQGCSVDVDNFTWIMKRQGFPIGNYFIDMPVMDNDFIIFVNASQVYQHFGGCCGPYNGIALGILNATSIVEIRVNDLGAPGEARVNFISDLQAGTIGSNQVFCNNTSVPNLFNSVVDAYGGLTAISYQWQDSIVNGTWQNIIGATSTTYQAPTVTQDIYYRRKATNVANEIAFSNILFLDFQGVLFYQDTDGDGFGNPLVSQLACTAPSGYVAYNTDCNDNDPLQKPGQTWYLDMDNDGYVTNASASTPITQCNRPLGGKLAVELIGPPYLNDCNDNHNHIHPGAQYVTYTGAPNYTNNIVFPLTGDPFTNYHYEVMYYNIYNELPENGAPRLSVDFNQDFILDLIDKRVSMLPDDV
ncbi:MAG TPA: LamG domain-containing protein, partial [Chitinophagaceae bacterium]|nr:LamG domain-containing protein [Chitinophagaceae bacterium]